MRCLVLALGMGIDSSRSFSLHFVEKQGRTCPCLEVWKKSKVEKSFAVAPELWTHVQPLHVATMCGSYQLAPLPGRLVSCVLADAEGCNVALIINGDDIVIHRDIIQVVQMAVYRCLEVVFVVIVS